MKAKIFNSQEVQAIIDGEKTMFREVIKKTQIEPSSFLNRCATELLLWECPYQEGKKIFCKESFAEVEVGAGMGYNTGKAIIRRADDDYDVKWKPAQHMKQEHSPITLEITSIKVERLQDISYEDAIKEGIWNIQEKGSPRSWDIKNAFANSWNATHKKPEEKFEANPFVWVVDFKINK